MKAEIIEPHVPPDNDANMSYASNVDGSTQDQIKDEPTYENGYDGATAQPWNEEQQNEGHTNQYNDAPMEHEMPPIGIKEDG